MIKQKLILLFLLITFVFFHPAEVIHQPSVNDDKTFYDIASVRSMAVEDGWNNNLITAYAFYLNNSIINTEAESSILSSLPAGYGSTFLQSILLKRERRFEAMFDSLYAVIPPLPDFLPFYDQLVFAANSSGRMPRLKTRLNELKGKSKSLLYLDALILESGGEYRSALASISDFIKQDSLRFEAYFLLAKIYRGLGEYELSLNYLNKCRDLIKEDNPFLTDIIFAEGSLHFLSGNYDNAEKSYNAGFEKAHHFNDRRNIAKGRINLAIIEDIKGNVENAREHFYQASAIADSINDIETKAHALSELGVSYSLTNNLIESKQNYSESYRLFLLLGNKLRLSLLSENIGKIYMALFDFGNALKYFKQGLDYSGENKRAAALNYIGIADVYSNLSNYSRALLYYRKAQELSSKIKEISLSAEINIGIGSMHFNLSRYRNAAGYFNRAAQSAETSGDPFLIADVHHKLGLSYLMMDSLSISENYINRAIELAENSGSYLTGALAYIDLASLKIKQNKFESAREHLTNAGRLSDILGMEYLSARIRLIEGDIFFKLNNFSEAQNNYLAALQSAKAANEFNVMIDAHYYLAKLYDHFNLNEAAYSHYSEAVRLIDDVSRPLFGESEIQISYFSGRKEVFDSFTDFYIKDGRYDKALELIDRSRSRNMMQNLNNLKLLATLEDKTTLEKLYEYEWILHSGLYSEKETDSAAALLRLLKKEILTNNPELEKYIGESRHPNLSHWQKKLADDEILLLYHSNESNTYAFIISRLSFDVVELGISGREITEVISGISPQFDRDLIHTNMFINHDLFSFNARESYKAYELIFKPLKEHIPKNKKLIISPSSELLTIPFELLVTEFAEDESPYRYSRMKYLIYDYSISYAPSPAVFLEQQKSIVKNNEDVLLLGDPMISAVTDEFAERRGLLEDSPGIPRNLSLLPLRFSGEEINEIGSIISANRVLTGANATETNFKRSSENSRIIHLSTHSYLFNKQPVIFFSNVNDAENDGILEASEIVQLKLNSDLVVLSSCNSGMGDVDESEGIIGMTKAFFEAGAKSVVVSLWEVNDKYTSKLMTLFYEHLSRGMGKADALRNAKIDFINDYSPNPYYWSAFILSGNTDAVIINASGRSAHIILMLGGVIIVSLLMMLLIQRRKSV